jgi:formylmethanofuran dehydrogenase subunit E
MQGNRDSKKRRRDPIPAQLGEKGEPHCTQCGEEVSPLEALLSPVCDRCVRENHRRAVGR